MPVFQPDLRSILAGFSGMLVVVSVTVLALGVVGSVPVLLVSGLVAGIITGWVTVGASRISMLSNAIVVGIFHASIAAGLGGILVYLSVLLWPGDLAGALVASWGGPTLLLVASPLAVFFFGLKGVLGGAVGATLRMKVPRSSAPDPDGE